MDFDELMRRLDLAVQQWGGGMAMDSAERMERGNILVQRARDALFAWQQERKTLLKPRYVSELPDGHVRIQIRFSWAARTWIKEVTETHYPKEGERFYLDGWQTQAFKVEAVTHQLGNRCVVVDCAVERLDVDDMGKSGYRVENDLAVRSVEIQRAKGEALDRIGAIYGIERDNEGDDTYRARILSGKRG